MCRSLLKGVWEVQGCDGSLLDYVIVDTPGILNSDSAMQHFRPILTLVSLSTSFWVFQWLQATAQIIPDNSLGVESSVVVPNVEINGINSDRIDGGAIRESNLFHSFREFNIDNGRGAYFSNPESIVNILTRVTGNNLS